MKKNKPRWKNLDMWERLARRCKQKGASEDTVGHIREHGKQREIEKNQQMKYQFYKERITRQMQKCICLIYQKGEQNGTCIFEKRRETDL